MGLANTLGRGKKEKCWVIFSCQNCTSCRQAVWSKTGGSEDSAYDNIFHHSDLLSEDSKF